MTLEEAIEIKQEYHEKFEEHMLSTEKDADKMSIEALKRLQQYREFHRSTADGPLPGETEGG